MQAVKEVESGQGCAWANNVQSTKFISGLDPVKQGGSAPPSGPLSDKDLKRERPCSREARFWRNLISRPQFETWPPLSGYFKPQIDKKSGWRLGRLCEACFAPPCFGWCPNLNNGTTRDDLRGAHAPSRVVSAALVADIPKMGSARALNPAREGACAPQMRTLPCFESSRLSCFLRYGGSCELCS
jgi:hypothetical protein